MRIIAHHLMIHGRVQGVWYRGWTVETARRLGLTGRVRNRMDGSVEAMIQGEPAIVAQFEALAMNGPTAARVTRIDAHDAAAEPLDGFEQRPTA